MKRNSEFREAARQSLAGKWNSSAFITLLSLVIVMIPAIGPIALQENTPLLGSMLNIAYSIAVIPLSYGLMIAFLDLKRENREIEVTDIFQGYKLFSRIVITYICKLLYYIPIIIIIVVGSLFGTILFFYLSSNTFIASLIALYVIILIYTIIVELALTFVNYVIKDYPQKRGLELLTLSYKIMKGHMRQLFLLELSFIGWGLLCILSLGIGYLWLCPYMQVAIAHFYEDAKQEWDARDPMACIYRDVTTGRQAEKEVQEVDDDMVNPTENYKDLNDNK